MSLEPSARYADAGQFADALVKYHRRAKLLERYQKAREYNEALREKYEIRDLAHSDRAHLLADTIGNVNDLMHIRQNLAETEKDSAEKSALFREVFETEFNARKILLSKTIALKDFGQASIQLETGLQSCADYRDQLQTEPEEMTHFLEQSSRDLTRGLAAQWRDRLMKWVALSAICFAVFCVILNLSLWVRSEQKDKIHAMNEAKLEHHLFLTEKDRVQFEKKVFPLSIDYSYMEAFAKPLIAHDRGKKCIIIAAMPKNYSELENKPWQKKEAVKRDLEALGWTCEGKMYTIENWTRPLVTDLIRPDGKDIPDTNVYIDVVSQLSAVKKVLDYLTQDNDFHSIEEREALAHEYVNEFKEKLVQLLKEKESVKDCSWDIKYVTDKSELKRYLTKLSIFSAFF